MAVAATAARTVVAVAAPTEAAAQVATVVVGTTVHWARECKKKKRDEQAHAAEVDDGVESALLVACADIDTKPVPPISTEVHLDEPKLFVQLGDKIVGGCTRWILDSGATNHMTGERTAFSELDTKIHGTVCFGDGSVTKIEGRGMVLLQCKNGEHKALVGVYLIPRLTTNIVSLGQLEEDGCRILLFKGFLKIWGRKEVLLAKVGRAMNRLYALELNVVQPVCLTAQGSSVAWRWHGRYGHLNFKGLRRLAEGGLVDGLPQINHVDQVCDSCLAGKQKRLSFPSEAKYRAAHRLELVHGDLCGPVTPVALSGNKFFFLLVNDLSRYMWVSMMSSKDQAMTAFMAFKGRAEAQSRRKLRTLHTDHRGEFSTCAFLDHCVEEGIQRHLTAPYTPEQNGVVE
jgi:transposase InsO family protein